MSNLGKELTEKRLLHGFTLKDISEITKIDVKYLEKMEKNEFDFLPQIYVKSFLRGYLRAVEADEKEFISCYEGMIRGEHKPPSDFEKESQELGSVDLDASSIEFEPEKTLEIGKFIRSNTTLFISIIAILAVVIIILLLKSERKDSNSTEETSLTEERFVPQSSPGKAKIGREKITSIPISKDSLTLLVQASDSVWIQVKGDGAILEELLMKNGEKKFWRSKKYFELLVGSAGALSFSLNGENLPFAGMPGAVKRIYIDSNGLKLIRTTNEPKDS